ncbi:hypothetical protein Tco_1203109 [Tanacetum coccineum]
MANLKYSDKHNMVAFLKKPNESVGFTEVVDFLKGTSLRYALTHNPTIYDSLVKQFWQTATVRTLANGTQQLVASIDSKEYTITLRHFLEVNFQLAEGCYRIHNLYDDLKSMLIAHIGVFSLNFDQKAFANMKRGYAGDIVPLLPAMLAGAAEDQGEGSAQPAKPHHTYVDPISSTSQPLQSPPHPSPPPHLPLQSPPHSPPHSLHQSLPFSPPHFLPPRSYKAPLPKGNTSGSAKDSMQLKELMKVKSLETALKKKSKKVLISELEGEESEDQGKKIQDIDDDPQVSLVRESMKEKSTDFSTPTKVSGEAQEEEINPTILEAAKTLSKNEILLVFMRFNIVSTKVDSGTASKRGQREGKAPIIEEDIQATHKTKEQIRQEEAGLEEAIKLQAQLDEERKELRTKEKKPWTQSQLRIYMSNYLKNQGTWKLSHYKGKLKDMEKNFRQRPSKKLRLMIKDVPGIGDKVAEVKEEEPVKRTGKRNKQKTRKVEARKGVNVDKSAQEDSKTNKEESVEAMFLLLCEYKSDSVVYWKIFQQGKDVFIDNESNGADTLHELLEPMVLRLHREDLYMLYWTMFDPPLNEDAIWSLPLQQKMDLRLGDGVLAREVSSLFSSSDEMVMYERRRRKKKQNLTDDIFSCHDLLASFTHNKEREDT